MDSSKISKAYNNILNNISLNPGSKAVEQALQKLEELIEIAIIDNLQDCYGEDWEVLSDYQQKKDNPVWKKAMEKNILKIVGGEFKTIEELKEYAKKSLLDILNSPLPEEKMQPLHPMYIEETISPTNDYDKKIPGISNTSTNKLKSLLLDILLPNGLYISDLENVTISKTNEKYFYFTIPTLSITVIFSNDAKEATYLYFGIIPLEHFITKQVDATTEKERNNEISSYLFGDQRLSQGEDSEGIMFHLEGMKTSNQETGNNQLGNHDDVNISSPQGIHFQSLTIQTPSSESADSKDDTTDSSEQEGRDIINALKEKLITDRAFRNARLCAHNNKRSQLIFPYNNKQLRLIAIQRALGETATSSNLTNEKYENILSLILGEDLIKMRDEMKELVVSKLKESPESIQKLFRASHETRKNFNICILGAKFTSQDLIQYFGIRGDYKPGSKGMFECLIIYLFGEDYVKEQEKNLVNQWIDQLRKYMTLHKKEKYLFFSSKGDEKGFSKITANINGETRTIRDIVRKLGLKYSKEPEEFNALWDKLYQEIFSYTNERGKKSLSLTKRDRTMEESSEEVNSLIKNKKLLSLERDSVILHDSFLHIIEESLKDNLSKECSAFLGKVYSLVKECSQNYIFPMLFYKEASKKILSDMLNEKLPKNGVEDFILKTFKDSKEVIDTLKNRIPDFQKKYPFAEHSIYDTFLDKKSIDELEFSFMTSRRDNFIQGILDSFLSGLSDFTSINDFISSLKSFGSRDYFGEFKELNHKSDYYISLYKELEEKLQLSQKANNTTISNDIEKEGSGSSQQETASTIDSLIVAGINDIVEILFMGNSSDGAANEKDYLKNLFLKKHIFSTEELFDYLKKFDLSEKEQLKAIEAFKGIGLYIDEKESEKGKQLAHHHEIIEKMRAELEIGESIDSFIELAHNWGYYIYNISDLKRQFQDIFTRQPKEINKFISLINKNTKNKKYNTPDFAEPQEKTKIGAIKVFGIGSGRGITYRIILLKDPIEKDLYIYKIFTNHTDYDNWLYNCPKLNASHFSFSKEMN